MPEHLQATYPGLKITRDDRLLIQAWAVPTGLVLHLCGRIFQTDDTVVPYCSDFDLTGAAAKDEFEVGVTPGLLDACTVYIESGSSDPGDIFVQVSMLHGRRLTDMSARLLIAGYIGGESMRGWPCSPCELSV